MKDWNAAPILSARNLTRRYGEHIGCRDVSFDLWPGEVLGIVGESGSGKSTLLNMLSGRMEPTSGTIAYRDAAGRERNIHALPEGEKRRLLRSELGFVHQRPSDGLRMQVSAGANIGERLMAEGARHYGTLRGRALQWLERVEIDAGRIDDKPALYSGGMQQRLQIARNLVTSPRLVFMDEPTTFLDIGHQLEVMALARRLAGLGRAVVLVLHGLDLALRGCDRVAVLSKGTLRALGSPEEVFSSGVLDQVFGVGVRRMETPEGWQYYCTPLG